MKMKKEIPQLAQQFMLPASHYDEEKADFVKAPNGSIGMETSLAVGITCLVKRGLLTLDKLVEKMSVNPAKILGINAGTLAVGVDADIALVDLDEEWTVDVDKLHGKSKNTPFKGMELQGKVKLSLSSAKSKAVLPIALSLSTENSYFSKICSIFLPFR